MKVASVEVVAVTFPPFVKFCKNSWWLVCVGPEAEPTALSTTVVERGKKNAPIASITTATDRTTLIDLFISFDCD